MLTLTLDLFTHSISSVCLLGVATLQHVAMPVQLIILNVSDRWAEPISNLVDLVRAEQLTMSDVKFSKGGEDETKVTFISGNHKTISSEDKGMFFIIKINAKCFTSVSESTQHLVQSSLLVPCNSIRQIIVINLFIAAAPISSTRPYSFDFD